MTYAAITQAFHWKLTSLLMLLVGLVLPLQVSAEQVTVAVAYNFMKPMAALKQDFEGRTGHMLAVSFGSSGRLFAQITNGAPFDVFLSADEAKADAVVNSGLALARPRNYATGRVVLWSPNPKFSVMDLNSLEDPFVTKIAIANPRLAPYGLAAQQALENLGLYQGIEGKLVMGENIAQAYQFAYTGSAQLGFVALSQVLGIAASDEYWIVPENLHQPIQQAAVLLTRARNNKAAIEFFDYLASPAGAELIVGFGYSVPNNGEGAR